jgi:alpha-galactosidase
VYKAQRELIATGRMVRWDSPDPSLQVTGVVAQDASKALFSVATLATSANEVLVPVRFEGLDPDRAYRVELALPLGPHAVNERHGVAWLDAAPVLSGRVLAELGLPMPVLNPEQALLITLTA